MHQIPKLRKPNTRIFKYPFGRKLIEEVMRDTVKVKLFLLKLKVIL